MQFLKNNFFPTILLAFVFTFVIISGCFILLNQIETLKTMKAEIHQDLNYLKNSQTSDRDELNKQLTLLREELIKYKSQQEGRDQILGLTKMNQLQNQIGTAETPTPTIQVPISIKGIIKLKKNWQTTDVFQEAKASSKIIGQLIRDKLYFVYEVVSGWYRVEYSANQQGWVQATLVDEL